MVAPALILGAVEIARHVLPGLIGTITGKGGEKVAEAVIETAAKVTGIASRNDAGDLAPGFAPAVVAELDRRPELLVHFRARLLEHREIMTRLDNADRADARARDVKLRDRGQRNLRADGLAFLAFLLFAVVVLRLVWYGIPESTGQVLLVLLGQLSALVAAVYHFEFGSSGGSKEKDAVIASGRPS